MYEAVTRFGIEITPCDLRPDFLLLMFAYFMDTDDRQSYIDYCKENKISCDDRKSFIDYANSKHTTLAFHNSMMQEIVNIFNKQYNLYDELKFQYHNEHVFYECGIPEDDSQKERILTQKQVQNMLAQFFGKLVKDNVSLTCQSIGI